MDLIFFALCYPSIQVPKGSREKLTLVDDGLTWPSVPLKAVIASIMITNQVNVLETAIWTLTPSPRLVALMKPRT